MHKRSMKVGLRYDICTNRLSILSKKIQFLTEGNFQWFDYGLQENKRRYGQDKPPSYNITEIRTPFSLFYAQNDWLAGPKVNQIL